MNKQMESVSVEEALEILFDAPGPDSAFVARLEQKLVTQLEARAEVREGRLLARLRRFWQWPQVVRNPLPQARWAVAAVFVLLALAVALFAAGPERVWARLQAWLAYVPNVGFVELEGARVLPGPQAITRDGITVVVERVVAAPEETTIVVRSEGLPPEDDFGPEGADRKSPLPRLQLPDGTMLTPKAWTLRAGAAALIFPPLPPTVQDVHLYMARLPLVPDGVAPDEWLIPLALEPVSTELLAEIQAATDPLLPGGYIPAGASDTRYGVTASVLGVAHTVKETALHLEIAWEDERLALFFPAMATLVDQQGNVYGRRAIDDRDPRSEINSAVFAPPPRDRSGESREEGLLSLEPLLPSVEQLTLKLEDLWFRAEVGDTFVIDLGNDPQIGDSWDLDIALNVVGVPVHITRAELVNNEMVALSGPGTAGGQTALVFHWTATARDGKELYWLGLGGYQAFEKGFGGGGGGPGWTALRWSGGDTLPAGQMEIKVETAGGIVRGPWEMTWPGPDASR